MNKKHNTKDITLAAILTAFSMIITLVFPKIIIGPFSMTFASHVPTMIALFINPFVTILTVIGSTLGFFLAVGPLVAIRAATHLLFGLMGYYMVRKNINIFITIIVTSVLHAGAEAICVYFLTDLLSPASLSADSIAKYGNIVPANMTPIKAFTLITFYGTLVQHTVDCVIAIPVVTALKKTKMIRRNITIGFKKKALAVQQG